MNQNQIMGFLLTYSIIATGIGLVHLVHFCKTWAGANRTKEIIEQNKRLNKKMDWIIKELKK